MDIRVKQVTTIKLTKDDISQIIKEHLATKGYNVDSIRFDFGTAYTDHMDSYGTTELEGATLEANITNKEEKI